MCSKKSGITKTISWILIYFKFVKINRQSICFHTFVDVESFKVMLDTFRKKYFFLLIRIDLILMVGIF